MKDSFALKLPRILLCVGVFFACFASQSAQAATAPRVVLLLHGMSGSPATWDRFMADIHGTAPSITKGVLFRTAIPVNNVYYYTVKFGAYDSSSGRTGINGLSTRVSASGDFSTYETLGTEVRNAIDGIRSRHPNAQVLLVGHSRGGLAGRALLEQSTSSAAKSAVIGLLTLGTPHQGSNFGRIYPYLKKHSSFSSDWKTWMAVTLVKTAADFDPCRPTTGDLATGSDPIKSLNSAVTRLPVTNIKYRAYVYGGVSLGKMEGGVDILSSLSGSARDYISDGKSSTSLKGDGTVQESAQSFAGLPGLPAGIQLAATRVASGVIHTTESERTSDINAGMKTLASWW